MASSKIRLKKIPTDKEIVDMIKREDYYLILKLRRSKEDKTAIRWNVFRTKWSILNQFGKL